MLYVAHAQPATAQLGAVRCDFLQPGREVLVINKLTRLEVCELVGSAGDEGARDGTEQIKSLLEIPLWGSIACLESIKLEGDSTSSLLVLTTSLQLFSLQYQPSTGSPTITNVTTTSTTSIHDPFARLSEFQTILVDQQKRCIVVLAYNGLIRVIPLPNAGAASDKKSSKKRRPSELAAPSSGLDLSRGYNVRLPSLNVTSLVLLPSATPPAVTDEAAESHPALASLSTSSSGRPTLLTYFLDLSNKELVDGPLGGVGRTVGDAGAELLIPVEAEGSEEAGVMVVGEESVVWVSLAPSSAGDGGSPGKGKGKRRASESSALSGVGASSSSSRGGAADVSIRCRLPVGQIQASTQLSKDSFLMGDIYGQLLLIHLSRNASGRVSAITSTELGDTASPTALVTLSPSSSRLVYLASRFGDSQLIRLPSELSPTSSSLAGEGEDAMEVEQDEAAGLELVQSFASLAPILDAVVVEGDGGGASLVVTCSGAYKGGSLRVVRQGVGLTELANLEMEGIQRMWSLKRPSRPQDPLLVLSFFNETQILSLTSSDSGEEEIEEIDLPSFSAAHATLLAASLDGDLLVQVTSEGANWGEETQEGGKWRDLEGKKITLAASAEGVQSKSDDTGGKYILLALEGGTVVLLEAQGKALVEAGRTKLANEIACLSLNIVDGTLLASLALWTLNTVHLFAVPSLAELVTQVVDTSYLIRSVLVQRFEDGVVSLLVGGGDGSVTSWVLESTAGALQVLKGSEKTVSLGTKPITMGGIKQKGVTGENVLVSSDRPTVISRSGDRLVYSSVNLKDITTFTPFSTSLYPTALALATPTNLLIGRISSIQRVDIRAIPLDEDEPRRIAHDPKSRSYGVVCLRRDVDRKTGVQSTRGSFKVLDDETFEVLANIQMQLNEEGQSITLVRTAGDRMAFVVGTTFIDSAEPEPSKGRLLLVAEDGDSRTFQQISETQIDGCPYALASAGEGHLAAAINSKVTIYSIDGETHYLNSEATWGGAFVAFNLVSVGPSETTFLVGDALRSVTVLHLTTSPAYKIQEVARDYDAHYMSAVEALGDTEEDEMIGAETDLNLFTVRKEKTTTTRSIAVDDSALAPRGVFHLGEMVSRFRRGSLVQQLGDSVGVATPRLVFATSAGSLGIVAELNADSSKLLSDLERNMRGVLEGCGGLKQEEYRSFKSERHTAPPAGFVDGNFVDRFAELSPENVERVMQGRNEYERLSATKEEVLRVVEEMARMH